MCGTFGSGLADFLGLCADTYFSDAVHAAHHGYSWMDGTVFYGAPCGPDLERVPPRGGAIDDADA